MAINEKLENGKLETYRRKMVGLAYRMIGTLDEAEDIAQEALLKWVNSNQAEIQSPLAWLSKVTTRLALDYLKSAKVLRESYVGPWLPEPFIQDEKAPDFIYELDESISIALLVILERLAPLERAAYILHDIFKYKHTEIAKIINQTPANSRQLVSRTRKKIKNTRAKYNSHPQEQRELIKAFFDAIKQGNISQLHSVLSNHVKFYADGGGKAVAAKEIIISSNNVVAFILEKLYPPLKINEVRMNPVWFNGSPGVLMVLKGKPITAFSFLLEKQKIMAIYAIRNPDKLARF